MSSIGNAIKVIDRKHALAAAHALTIVEPADHALAPYEIEGETRAQIMKQRDGTRLHAWIVLDCGACWYVGELA